MTGKFLTATSLTLLLMVVSGIHASAQDAPPAQSPAVPAPAPAQQPPVPATPAAQQPAAQPDHSQEPADEISSSMRRQRARDYKKWVYNVGAGANIDSGATKTYVRSGGGLGTAGIARNANKYLGLRADFFFTNLPLRDSTLELAGATSANNYALAFTLDPVINFPVTNLWGGYILFGPGYYHRFGTLNDDSTTPGSACNHFWTWWGACSSLSVPLNNSFVNSSLNQVGYNVGVGVTRKMPSGVEVYAEFRLNHASGDYTTTDYRPVTLGVRW